MQLCSNSMHMLGPKVYLGDVINTQSHSVRKRWTFLALLCASACSHCCWAWASPDPSLTLR